MDTCETKIQKSKCKFSPNFFNKRLPRAKQFALCLVFAISKCSCCKERVSISQNVLLSYVLLFFPLIGLSLMSIPSERNFIRSFLLPLQSIPTSNFSLASDRQEWLESEPVLTTDDNHIVRPPLLFSFLSPKRTWRFQLEAKILMFFWIVIFSCCFFTAIGVFPF